MTRIRRLRIAGFRGARFDLPIDLTKEHRSIAFYGENASGKSTLTDALEWFINNRVQHLWREGCKQDALRNVLCNDDEPSQVEVHFSGNSLSGIKTLSPALETEQSNENPDFTSLIDHLADDHIFLRHADITRFLDADKGKKREAIASFIGYEEITKFRGHIQSAGNTLQRDTTYTTAKSQLETHKTTIMGLVGEAVTDMSGCYKKANELTKPFAISATITDDKTYEQAVDELQKSSTDPAKTSKAQQLNRFEKECIDLHISSDAVLAAIMSFTAPYNKIVKEKDDVSKIRIAEFLEKGDQVIEDKLFTDPNCPFCLSDYDLPALQTEVQARLTAIAQLQQKFNLTKASKDNLDAALTRAHSQAQSIANNYSDLDSFKTFTDAAKTEAASLSAFTQLVNTTFGTLDALTVDKKFLTSQKNLSANAKTSATKAQQEGTKLAMTEQEKQLALTLITLDQLHTAVSDYVKKNQLVKLYEAQILTLSAIFDSFVEIQNSALQAILDTVSKDVGAFYKKLHPKENIDEVRLTMVGDEGVEFQYAFHGKKAQPPRKYLSESHLNSLGIVLFLANARLFNKQARFLVLDDIVTSFDTGHRRRLLRLLKEEFSDWQIILLTHDAVMFDLIKKEFAESGWLFKEVHADDENGIRLEQSAKSFRALIIEKRAKHDVSNDLRKLMEATLKEIAFALGVKVAFRFNNLNERRMSGELLSALRSTLNKHSSDLAKNPIFSNLSGSNLIATIGSHDNPELIVGDDIDVALEDVDQLAALFSCSDCKQYIKADIIVPGKNKISCRCGNSPLEWKN